ncbi:hypothetical protein PF003_g26734 [Phytophthora fragariae]|nr:hypothetical protein PF003_g26734 [Phytophthora fragariae]
MAAAPQARRPAIAAEPQECTDALPTAAVECSRPASAAFVYSVRGLGLRQ